MDFVCSARKSILTGVHTETARQTHRQTDRHRSRQNNHTGMHYKGYAIITYLEIHEMYVMILK